MHDLITWLVCTLPAVMLMFVTTTWAEASFLTQQITYAAFYGGFGWVVKQHKDLVLDTGSCNNWL